MLVDQHGGHDRAGIDVVEDDGLARRRDAAGEAFTDGYAQALADLVVEPGGGRRDEIAGFRVEEHHGGGVDLQQIAGAFQQFGQQRVDVQSGQGRVGHRLQPAQRLPASGHPVAGQSPRDGGGGHWSALAGQVRPDTGHFQHGQHQTVRPRRPDSRVRARRRGAGRGAVR